MRNRRDSKKSNRLKRKRNGFGKVGFQNKIQTNNNNKQNHQIQGNYCLEIVKLLRSHNNNNNLRK